MCMTMLRAGKAPKLRLELGTLTLPILDALQKIKFFAG